MNMLIVVRTGTPMFVSGTTLAGGNLQGSISGPLAGDEGTWTARKLAATAPAKAQTAAATTTQPLVADCTASSSSCSPITIQGDPPDTLPNGQLSPFRGYADPSLRKDPLSKRLWMSYSWPHVETLNGRAMGSVDIHLAYSDDGGKTWQYQGRLWPSFVATDKGGTGATGYTSNEVSNIYPALNGQTVTWYGIHESYFVPAGGYRQRSATSFRLQISQAATPQGLATADTAILGSATTATGWGINTRLSTLSPAVQNCTIFTEPALYAQNGILYLMTHCLVPAGSGINSPVSNLVVFATQPTGDVRTWKWRYVGTLLKGSDVSALGIAGAQGFTQGDLAKSKAGNLVLIVTPDASVSPPTLLNHFGCWVLQMNAIDPPGMRRDASGKLTVLAKVTATDLGPTGPGACTYDPASATGIIIVRRAISQGSTVAAIYRTGIAP